MNRLLAGLILFLGLVAPAAAASLDAASINEAKWQSKSATREKIDPAVVKMQVLLDRAGFSPGEIDGRLGENALKALRAFADAKGLAFDGHKPTSAIWDALTATSEDPIVTDYKLSEKDVKGPFLDKVPAKMEDMQGLKALAYTSPREELAEKFQMSESLLSALNPSQKFDQAGEQISVLNVAANDDKSAGPKKEKSAAGEEGKTASKEEKDGARKEKRQAGNRVEVDKTRQTVKVFNASGDLIAFFPATVGSKEKPTPDGVLKVTSIDANPSYHYNPDYNFKGVKTKQPFTINPGPNNPVGSYWIGLSAEGYGIHGTPEPSKVSKAASHGCVRLTNWDAGRLAKLVKKGTEVAFVGDQQASRQ